MKISIETTVNAPIERVWTAWTQPDEITKWNFASDDWCCPNAAIDLNQGGSFSYRMEAKDGSVGFDFSGRFTAITPRSSIRYVLDDERSVEIDFIETQDGIRIMETFEAENEFSAEQQRAGWQSILDNFKNHAEKV